MILHHVENWPRRASSIPYLLLLLALLWAPRAIGATATQTLQPATCTAPAATLTLPAVTIQPNTPVGTLIGTPATTSITFTCSNLPVSSNGKTTGTVSTADRTAFIQAGDTLAPLDPTNVPTGPGITFATNLSGIALLLTAGPVQASSQSGGNPSNDGPGSLAGYPVGFVTGPTSIPETCTTKRGVTTCTFTCVTAIAGTPADTSGCFAGTVSESFTAQLKVTGPLTSASIGSINAVQLMPFWWYIPGGDQDSTSQQISGSVLNLAGGTAVTLQACTINTDSQNKTVTLPAVVANALTSTGATAGTTQFNLNLTCQSGVTASITMTTANQATATGVIAPTTGSGFAKNVGLRILNSSSAPITFGTAQNLGATPSGALSLSYFAQYYVTATPVTAGNVAGTVTFTMAYQ